MLRPRPFENIIERIADRLVVLLRESENPEREMSLVLDMLAEADLWWGNMNAESVDNGSYWLRRVDSPGAGIQLTPRRFFGFARNVIVENPDVRAAIRAERWVPDPQSAETVEELILSLLPNDHHLD